MVFSTKRRIPLFTGDVQPHLYSYMGTVLRTHDSRLLSAGGTADHIHLLASIGKQLAISELVREVKAKSSGWIHREFPRMKEFRWQSGYAAFSVSSSGIETVRRYIESQCEHHKRSTFQDELRTLLRLHNVEFDERYLWD
jgi:REP element-mobilizing transposase RayT